MFFPKDAARDFYTHCVRADVAAIAGVRLCDDWIDVPYTAWMLDDVVALLDEFEVKLPSPLDSRLLTVELPQVERELYAYQVEGINFLLDYPGALLTDEMGLGKTAQAAVAAEATRRCYERPAVIVGTLVVQQTWRRELQALGFVASPDDYCALASTNIDHASFRKDAKWYFVHYEIVKAWWSMLHSVRPCVAIIDEAHYVKNSKTRRSNGAALAMTGTAKRILLTGTPLENRPSDLWYLLTLACGPKTWGTFTEFRLRYCGAVHNGYTHVDMGPTNVAELRERLKCCFLRRTTADAGIELPEFTRSTQYCDMGEYKEAYDELVTDLELYALGSLDQLVRAISEGLVEKVLPELTRLRQLTSRAKVPATREYVANALEQGEAVVVFTWERETAAQIFNHKPLGRYHKFLAHGGVPQKTRDEYIDEFQATKEPAVMVTTYGAMREGVTLHRARICVMHDLEWFLTAMLQAEKRVHRLGQQRNCQSVWMLARQSMDTLIAPILLRKAELMHEILGIRHDISSDIGLTELAGRKGADALVAQAFAAWDGNIT